MTPLNFNTLFMTARVVTAIYRVAITSVLLVSLARRVREGRKVSTSRRIRDV